MLKKKGFRIGLVLALAVTAAAVFAVVGRADDPVFDQVQSSVGPSFVDANGDVLFRAQWHDNDNRSFTHASVVITVHPGWTLISSDPSGCTQAGVTITCDWGKLTFGELVAQEVRLRTNGDLGVQPIHAELTFYEGNRNPGRFNHVPVVPDAQAEVISSDPNVTPDKAGNCVNGNGSVQTVADSGESETTATAPSSGALCTPLSIEEQPRHDPLEFCLPDRQCVTELVRTDAAQVSPNNPIRLQIIFRGTGLNSLSLIFNSLSGQREVPQCTNNNRATPDPCYTNKRARQQSVTWSLNWSGADPTWTS